MKSCVLYVFLGASIKIVTLCSPVSSKHFNPSQGCLEKIAFDNKAALYTLNIGHFMNSCNSLIRYTSKEIFVTIYIYFQVQYCRVIILSKC